MGVRAGPGLPSVVHALLSCNERVKGASDDLLCKWQLSIYVDVHKNNKTGRDDLQVSCSHQHEVLDLITC